MDTKDLLKIGVDYKSKATKISGIYIIYCLRNEMIYIGSSSNYWHRKQSHQKSLKSNKHKNPHLQNAYNSYGRESFLHLLIEEVKNPTTEILLERENFYLSQFSKEQLFNSTIPAILGGVYKGFSDQTLMKISNSSKEKWKDPLYREKMKESMKKALTDEVRAKISNNSKKNMMNPEYREKVLQNLKMSDKKRKTVQSSEYRKSMSDKIKKACQRGSQRYNFKYSDELKNEIYKDYLSCTAKNKLKYLAEKYNIKIGTISWIISTTNHNKQMLN
jgi:group I intron endonuclease